MQTGIEIIAAERKRQVEAEGWTPEHDDEHDHNEMADAAAAYAVAATLRQCTPTLATGPIPSYWPWARDWWKPTPNDRIRELAKAGALIAAEIDRLQRMPPNTRI